MEHPISADRLTAQVAKVCGPNAPAKLKAMAAGGLAPLPPRDLVTALYVLSYDGDEQIGKKASNSLRTMPVNVLLGALEQIDLSEVLDGLAQLLISNVEAIEKILLNKHTVAESVVFIAQKSSSDRALEIVAANQERLLKHPEIIEALYRNKSS